MTASGPCRKSGYVRSSDAVGDDRTSRSVQASKLMSAHCTSRNEAGISNATFRTRNSCSFVQQVIDFHVRVTSPRILAVRSDRVRQTMCMSLARRRQCSFHRAFGIAFVGLLTLVGRKRASLSIGELCFFQLRHAAMSTRVQRERAWQANLGSHRLDDLLHPTE